jgi:hypothetical protein
MKTYITLQYVAMERAKNFQVAWGDALREINFGHNRNTVAVTRWIFHGGGAET